MVLAGWFGLLPGWAVVGVLAGVDAGVLSPVGRAVSVGVDAGNAGPDGAAVAVAEAVAVSVDTGPVGCSVVGMVGFDELGVDEEGVPAVGVFAAGLADVLEVGEPAVSVETVPLGFDWVGPVGGGEVGADGGGVAAAGAFGAGVVGLLAAGVPVVPGGVVADVVVSSAFDVPGFAPVGVTGVVAGLDGVVFPGVDGVDGVPFAGVDGVDGVRSSVLRDGSWVGIVPGTPEVGVVGLLGVVGWVGTEPVGVLDVGLFSRPFWSVASGLVDGAFVELGLDGLVGAGFWLDGLPPLFWPVGGVPVWLDGPSWVVAWLDGSSGVVSRAGGVLSWPVESPGPGRCGSPPVGVLEFVEPVGFGVFGCESLRWVGVCSVPGDWSCWVL
ncbi:hypothetical protein [Nocardia lijiangensis]|uniref:hypothetical protein n=1 Tax=Nocardia lijiangensis TaxID=299618 RepID=UPI000832B969|nr:hypothetical protein [Nocardia lijiangensis]